VTSQVVSFAICEAQVHRWGFAPDPADLADPVYLHLRSVCLIEGVLGVCADQLPLRSKEPQLLSAVDQATVAVIQGHGVAMLGAGEETEARWAGAARLWNRV
jgi:hypothetical protein